MNTAENNTIYRTVCTECLGQGKKKQRVRKTVRLRYESELKKFEDNGSVGYAPVRPKAHHFPCPQCGGSGLVTGESFPAPDFENFPHLAIIGGGIGGVALAVACLHRGIPFTLFERDENFEARSQGYGLTLQQASKAIEGFGITHLQEGIVSNRHLVHTPDGKIVGEWGMRKWLAGGNSKNPKHTNIHIARQSLRSALLQQLGTDASIKWGHQLVDFKKSEEGKIDLTFQVDGEMINTKKDLIVGADGIRSVVRNLIIPRTKTPLRYLDCIVILGICSLKSLKNIESSVLDSATVFQTANGNERIYMMPFNKDSVMWQLSFPMSQAEAIKLSSEGKNALKAEAIKRTPWHSPIPEIIAETAEEMISGYPVYDRELLNSDLMRNAGSVTLIGDAAHPMSPFKGQGANQALLDALSLAREIYKSCKHASIWKKDGIRKTILENFETEMLERSATKVQDSAAAAQFLHSDIALYEGNEPRGRVLKRKEH